MPHLKLLGEHGGTASLTGTTIRLRIDLAYDGTAFHGWGVQAGSDLRTVQAVVESALRLVFQRECLSTVVAGRTDAGVHATGQVVHVDVPADAFPRLVRSTESLSPEDVIARVTARLRSALARHRDIEIHRATVAPVGFHARFSPVSRTYHYRLADSLSVRNPLRRFDTARIRGELDVARMNAAAHALLGLHDWLAFAKPKPNATTIRDLLEFSWTRLDDDSGDGVVRAVVRADAFCHHQVRYLVGATLLVGLGQWTVNDVLRVRDTRVRPVEMRIAEPQGLTLVHVEYPGDGELAARAELTQARRSL